MEVIQDRHPVVVMFYAAWCPKCAMMKSMIEDMERKYKNKIKFCEVDTQVSLELLEEYGADVVPTFVLFKDGGVAGAMQGIIDETVFEERLQKIFRKS